MSWLKKLFKGKASGDELEFSDLFDSVRLSPLFKDVSIEFIQKLVGQATPVRAEEGDVIIREGEEGDFYYIVLDGMVTIVRRMNPGEDPKPVAVLAPGYSFGEEALISNAARNATAVMETDGMLLRIPKQAFVDYIMSSLVTWLTPIEAQKRVNAGAQWLDVRDATEHRRMHLPGALSAPLESLHLRLHDLDKGAEYVCYCQNGRRSATAAFVLRQAGHHVAVLQGGLNQLDRSRKR